MNPAVFTITRNEPFFLRVWCNYYCSSFPQADVYVLDNASVDGSVEQVKELYPQINVVNAASPQAFDHMWLKHTVETFQRGLLRKYPVVVFAETDEYLIPDLGRYQNIYEYCVAFANSKSSTTSVRARGWGIVHQIDKEPYIQLGSGLPLLAQRNSMWSLPDYSKTLITKVPLTYSKGFHITYTSQGKKDGSRPIEPDLSLLHAWHVDAEIYRQRHIMRKAVGSKQAFHGSGDLEQVNELFRTRIEPWNRDRLSPIYEGDEVAVPESWKALFRY